MILLAQQVAAGAPWWVGAILAPLGLAASGAVVWVYQRAEARNAALTAELKAERDARLAEHKERNSEMKDLLEDAVKRGDATEAALSRFGELLKGKRA